VPAPHLDRDQQVRIGNDARAAAEVPAGRGRYVRELLTALSEIATDNRYLLYARRRWNRDLDERFEWVELESPDVVWHWRAARHAGGHCDAFLSTNSYLTAWFTTVPTVLVVHDLIAFDRRYRPRARSALIEPATARHALRRACAIVADSQSTQTDLEHRFPVAATKTTAVPLAAGRAFEPSPSGDDDSVLARHGLDFPFVLAAGTLEPRKNLVRLIDAFSQLPESERHGHKLALVGATGWDDGQIADRIASLPEVVTRLDYVPDEHLPALYRRASLFCYPSLYEGFGLPVLEAMQCGTPVITSNVSSLPEVGGDAVAYVDPESTSSIRGALTTLLVDEQQRKLFSRRGVERSRQFNWRLTAERTLQVLERCVRADDA
jgi:alpha-1,3-rhamnosyl/mannosyltransferase